MNRIITTTLLISFFLLPSLSSAGQIGGFSQNIGGQMLTITANVGYKTRDVVTGGIDDDLSSRIFAVTTTYGLSDSLDIFLNLGFADVQDVGNFTGALGNLLGGGFKLQVVGGDSRNTDVSIITNVFTFESEDSGQSADYLEYHVAAVVSRKSGNFTPFGGLKLSDVEVDFEGGAKYEADSNFGLFGGVDYFVNPNVYFTGEVHIFDENALYMGVGYNF